MITTTMLLQEQTNIPLYHNKLKKWDLGLNQTCTKRRNAMDFLDEIERNEGEYLGGWVENKFLGSILQI